MMNAQQLTLRDKLAMAALVALIHSRPWNATSLVAAADKETMAKWAKAAYAQADAMITILEVQNAAVNI